MKAMFLAALIGLGLFCAPSAQALTWKEPLTLEQLAERAPLSFRGTVVDIDHRFVRTGEKRLPYTEVTFRVDAAYAGTERGKTIRLRQIGGPIPEGRTLVIPGLPQYSIDDQVVVFADPAHQPVAGALRGADSVYRVSVSSDQATVTSHHGTKLMPLEDFERLLGTWSLPEKAIQPIDRGAYEADLARRFGGA